MSITYNLDSYITTSTIFLNKIIQRCHFRKGNYSLLCLKYIFRTTFFFEKICANEEILITLQYAYENCAYCVNDFLFVQHCFYAALSRGKRKISRTLYAESVKLI